MVAVKTYHIPYWGDFGHFSITHVEEEVKHSNGQITEAGYYGIHGVMTVTRKCKTPEEAEQDLEDAIFSKISAERTNFERRLIELENIGDNLRHKGLSEYLVK